MPVVFHSLHTPIPPVISGVKISVKINQAVKSNTVNIYYYILQLRWAGQDCLHWRLAGGIGYTKQVYRKMNRTTGELFLKITHT